MINHKQYKLINDKNFERSKLCSALLPYLPKQITLVTNSLGFINELHKAR